MKAIVYLSAALLYLTACANTSAKDEPDKGMHDLSGAKMVGVQGKSAGEMRGTQGDPIMITLEPLTQELITEGQRKKPIVYCVPTIEEKTYLVAMPYSQPCCFEAIINGYLQPICVPKHIAWIYYGVQCP